MLSLCNLKWFLNMSAHERKSGNGTAELEKPLPIKSEEEAKAYLKIFLSAVARAKVFVTLYPEQHPIVQKVLFDLHNHLIRALKHRVELELEFQPGAIVVDGEYVIGDNENIARFSQDMYRRMIARLIFEGSLDIHNLFQFLKYITSEIKSVQKKSEAGKFPEFMGIRVERIEYDRLSDAPGEALTLKEGPSEKDKKIMEILFGKMGYRKRKDLAITDYIPLSEEFIQKIKKYKTINNMASVDMTLSDKEQIKQIFRNMVASVIDEPGDTANELSRDLAEQLYHMSPGMRSEMIVQEVMEKGGDGPLFKLASHLSEDQTEDILSPMRRQVRMEPFSDLSNWFKKIARSFMEQSKKGGRERRLGKKVPPEVVDLEYLDHFQRFFTKDGIENHYNELCRFIFQKSENPDVIARCIESCMEELPMEEPEKNLFEAGKGIRCILNTINNKKIESEKDAAKLTKIVENRTIEKILPIIREAAVKNDYETIAETGAVLTPFNIKPQKILLDILADVEEISVRKKIIRYVLSTGHISEMALIRMLNHENWYVARNAVTLIREMGDRDKINLLGRHLEHPEIKVRKEILRTLESLKSKESLNLLFRIYNSKAHPPEIRGRALENMGKYEDKRIRPLYESILSNEEPPGEDLKVRIAGIRQLGRYQDAENIQALMNFIKKPRLFHSKSWYKLKEAAMQALKDIGTIEARGALVQAEKLMKRR